MTNISREAVEKSCAQADFGLLPDQPMSDLCRALLARVEEQNKELDRLQSQLDKYRLKDLNQEELQRLVEYNPLTGVFTRRVTTSSTARAGDTAGSLASGGYIQFRLNGVLYMAHRLAWLYTTGKWPAQCIDHINGDPQNNRIENLREASHAENSRNMRIRANNTSGFRGVTGPTDSGRWRSQIGWNGKKMHLGTFDTPEEAHEAYCAAGRKYFGDFFDDEKDQRHD